jgi:hypothetical protein
MKIESGKFYINKTRKLLLPCLKDHGEKMMRAINALQKLAVGIEDNYFEKSLDKNNLFLLVDINGKDFRSILSWLRRQSFFVADYPFDDILTGYQHMIVVKIPEEYEIAKTQFVKGRYSRMYTKHQIDHLFGETIIDVFARSQQNIIDFVDVINKTYDSNIKYQEWKGEVDFPPKIEEETFN